VTPPVRGQTHLWSAQKRYAQSRTGWVFCSSGAEGQAAASLNWADFRIRPIFPFDLSRDRHGHGLDQCELLPKSRPSFPT
jgi:hypothetical protein